MRGRRSVGDDPLGRLGVGIDRERDALVQEALLAAVLAAGELALRQRAQPLVERAVVRAHGVGA